MDDKNQLTASGTQQRINLEEIISLMSQPAALLTASGQIEFCNDRFLQQLDIDSEVARGFEFAERLKKQDRVALRWLAKTPNTPDAGNHQISMALAEDDLDRKSALITRLENNGHFAGNLCQIEMPKAHEDARLRYVIEQVELGVWDYDARNNRYTVSDAWRSMRGVATGEELDLANHAWLKQVHPNDQPQLREALKDQAKGRTDSIVVQFRYRHAAGYWMWILCRSSVMETDARGRPTKIVGTDTDITQLKARENDLFELTGKLQLAIKASGMGIFEYDPVTSQVHWDDKMLEIYGITDGKNVRDGNQWEKYIHPDDFDETLAYAEECRINQTDLKRDYRIIRPDGKIRHIRSLARSVAGSNSEGKLIGVNIDISEDYHRTQELEMARRQLEHDSRHDALTGLGNRRKSDEVTIALFNRISADHRYVVMHIDLDHFKRVNDTLGHAAGDYVLSIVARKLTDIVGEIGKVFRIGGDEFTLVFEDAPDEKEIVSLCETVIEELSKPTTYQGQDCTIGASVGYAIGQGPPNNPSDIFINADTALYAAKNAGRSTYKAYSRELEAAAGQLENVRQDLIDALKNGEIICHFQPQYNSDTLEIIGAEALVRWQCPTRGLLTPDRFLPQATQTGLLPNIDEHVFRFVAAMQDKWAGNLLEYPRISINISKERLETEKLVEETTDILQPHHLIAFELLETAFLDRIDTRLSFKLDALSELGIRIELDDFGSGHSSITALQAVQPDGVKIDRSLVAPIETRPTQMQTLKSLTKIARLEGADVLVEGLETGIQLAAIRDLDCDALQGYALQRPMPAEEFTALLMRRDEGKKQNA